MYSHHPIFFLFPSPLLCSSFQSSKALFFSSSWISSFSSFSSSSRILSFSRTAISSGFRAVSWTECKQYEKQFFFLKKPFNQFLISMSSMSIFWDCEFLCLTLSLLGYLKIRICWGGGQFDPPPSKSHVWCLNMTNDTSLESSCALLLESAKKFANLQKLNFLSQNPVI